MRPTFVSGFVAAATAACLLAACGGDSSSGAATPSTTISGAAVKGPVANATVTVKNAATGATVGTTTTRADGTYSLSVAFSGDVVVEVSGGTYTDEATNLPTTLSAPMRTVITASGGEVVGVVTPLTTLAYTYAFGTAGTGATAAGFGTSASALATQFQLGNINLATAVPSVSGTTNAYGQVLRGISQYLQTQNQSLSTFVSTAFTTTQWQAFTSAYNAAYQTANPGSTVTFSFTGTGLTIAGTGAGGGSGTCGVQVTGTVSTGGFSVPLNLNYCIAGIAANSCTAGNASLSQGISGQGGVAGAANLQYTYSPTCASDAITIRLQ